MTSKIDSVTVYCSSSNLVDNKFTKEIKRVGKLLAQHQIKLVYGGGRAGLMGAISNSVMKNGWIGFLIFQCILLGVMVSM